MKSFPSSSHRFLFDRLQKLDDEYPSSRFALVRNDSTGEIHSIGRDFRAEHPLEHATLVAIDLLGKESFFHRDNLRPNDVIPKEKESHLLNGCSIYLTDEPCLMCSMALLHSRISSVYFLRSNAEHGSLLSHYQLHRLKETNHRFHAYHLSQLD